MQRPFAVRLDGGDPHAQTLRQLLHERDARVRVDPTTADTPTRAAIGVLDDEGRTRWIHAFDLDGPEAVQRAIAWLEAWGFVRAARRGDGPR